jgi:hypothetical protein
MKTSSLSALALLASAALLASPVGAQPTEIVGTLLGDTYSYWSVSDGGTRDRAAVFAFEQAPPPAPQFFFDYHDGLLIAQWELTLPAELIGATLNVVSATVEVWNRKGAQWNPASGDVRLFAAGFTGSNSFTEQTWTETTAYVGPSAFAPGARDPYPRDRVTDASAANNPAATPWAVGTINPADYTGVPANDPDEAFKITFALDVNNTTIQNELRDDLANGRSSWVIASTFAAAQPPAVAYYPEIVTKEGIANTTYGTAQQAPRLVLEVETVSSVANWHLFE